MGLPPPLMNDINLLDKNTSRNLCSGIDVTRRNTREANLALRLSVQLDQSCSENYQVQSIKLTIYT